MTVYKEALEIFWERLFDSLKIILDSLNIYRSVNEKLPFSMDYLNLFNPIFDEDNLEFHIEESQKNLLKIYFVSMFTHFEVYLLKIRNHISVDKNNHIDMNNIVIKDLEDDLELKMNVQFSSIKKEFYKFYEVRKAIIHRRDFIVKEYYKSEFLIVNSGNKIVFLKYEYLEECKNFLRRFVNFIDEQILLKFGNKFEGE